MKWKRGRGGNRDVVDVRGARGPSGGFGGGGFPIPGGIGRMGGGAGIVAVIVIVLINVLGSSGGGGYEIADAFGPQASAPGAADPAPIPRSEDPDADLKDFSVYVFEDVQSTWQKAFAAAGRPYDRAQLVLYSGAVSTNGCGSATAAVGPFYCPGDDSVYLDLSFYKQMADQLGASGDFAWAYVIAHEMGHHVQNVSGTTAQVAKADPDEQTGAEGLSVRTELQADCYAGVWASTVYKEGALDEGDIQEAFGAARAVGDDRLQKQATGTVKPDTFTHGTSQQRRAWFDRGYRSADPGACDTFSADGL
jgi:predicted metalloprotease